MNKKEIGRNEKCPCQSGFKYKNCCLKKDFTWVRDETGELFKSVPLNDEAMDILIKQRESFIEKFGREPGPDDPIFFDASSEAGKPQSIDHKELQKNIENLMFDCLKNGDMPADLVYASLTTGLMLTEENRKLMTQADLNEWNEAIDEYRSEAFSNDLKKRNMMVAKKGKV